MCLFSRKFQSEHRFATQRPIIEEDSLKLPIIGVCQPALFNQNAYYSENGIILKRSNPDVNNTMQFYLIIRKEVQNWSLFPLVILFSWVLMYTYIF